MKKSTKIILIIAAVLIVSGAILSLSAMAMGANIGLAVRRGYFSFGPRFEEEAGAAREFSAEGSYSIPAEGIENISVDWLSGNIRLESYEGSEILLKEEGPAEFTPRNSLSYSLSGKGLTVRFFEGCAAPGEVSGRSYESKELTIMLPEDMEPDKLIINTVNDKVIIRAIEAESLELNTGVSELEIYESELDRLSFSSVSSGIKASDSEIEKLDVHTVNGGIELKLSECPEKLDFDTVSGGAVLYLPENSSFRLKLDTVTGRLESEFGGNPGKDYSVGGGENKFSIQSVSGGVSIFINK